MSVAFAAETMDESLQISFKSFTSGPLYPNAEKLFILRLNQRADSDEANCVGSDHDWLLERYFPPWSRKKKFFLWP